MRRALALVGLVAAAFVIVFTVLFFGVVNVVERVIGVLVGRR